jgi:hypothetical protein
LRGQLGFHVVVNGGKSSPQSGNVVTITEKPEVGPEATMVPRAHKPATLRPLSSETLDHNPRTSE